MKKQHILLALAALFIVGAADAQVTSKIITAPKLKWSRGISSYGAGVTDSVRISIPSPSAAGGTDATDTTQWFDLGQYKFAQAYAKQPLVLFQINTQLSSTTDSIGYSVQYSNDLSTTTQQGAVALAYSTTVAATTAGITAGQDGIAFTVVAVSPDAIAAHGVGTVATLPWRFVRLVVNNVDATATTGRKYFSVTPVIYGGQ